jgi:fructose-bisphosphate aldolase class I
MDESNSTCNKRFAKVGISQTVEARRAYRELIITTPGLGESISGVILYDETIRQQQKDGTPFLKVLGEAGIIAGIKVDTRAKDLTAHPGRSNGPRPVHQTGRPTRTQSREWPRGRIARDIPLWRRPSSAPSSHVQPGSPPRRLQCRDG